MADAQASTTGSGGGGSRTFVVRLRITGAAPFGETIGVPIVLLATGLLLIVLMVLLLRRGAGARPLLR